MHQKIMYARPSKEHMCWKAQVRQHFHTNYNANGHTVALQPGARCDQVYPPLVRWCGTINRMTDGQRPREPIPTCLVQLLLRSLDNVTHGVIPPGTCTTDTAVSVPLPNSGRVGHTRIREKRNNLAVQAFLRTKTTHCHLHHQCRRCCHQVLGSPTMLAVDHSKSAAMGRQEQ